MIVHFFVNVAVYTEYLCFVPKKMCKKVRPGSSEPLASNPRTISVLRSGLNHNFYYPSHATQSGSVAAAAMSPLRTDSVRI